MSAHSDARHLPTSAALVNRLNIFQPSIRPVQRTGEWITTQWGKTRISGRLGQRHASVLELMMRTSLDQYQEPDGRLRLLIDPYKLTVGLSDRRYSGQRLNRLINELMAARVEWVADDHKSGGKAQIISEQLWAEQTDLALEFRTP